VKNIYFDTNQLYYIRRIAEEAEGWEYGQYEWAYRVFPNKPEFVQDIRALCYIVALQYEWDLDFSSSDASFTEVGLSTSKRAQATRDAWILFAEGLKDSQSLQQVPFLPEWSVSGRLSLDFIEDPDDRVIIRHFASERADVLLTSDDHILKHKDKLAELNLTIMRPSEWLNKFLENVRGNEDAVDWLERVLFGIRSNP
jgi:predicted nucleic acid-binding protein